MNGDIMYIDRKESPDKTIENLCNSKLSILYSEDESGLTFFLKKIQDILSANDICFYINSEISSIRNTIPIQIARQILLSCGYHEEVLKKRARDGGVKKKIRAIVKSLSLSVGYAPIKVSIKLGELIDNFFFGLENTLNVDLDHIGDYKIEYGIIKMLDNIYENSPSMKIYYLFDNAEKLNSDDFIGVLTKHPTSHVLFAYSKSTEIQQRIRQKAIMSYPKEIGWEFGRPDDDFIIRLFNQYNIDILGINFLLDKIRINERSIHVIMDIIHNEDFVFDEDMLTIIKILKILLVYNTRTPVGISEKILYDVLLHFKKKVDVIDEKISEVEFQKKLMDLLRTEKIRKCEITLDIYVMQNVRLLDSVLISKGDETQIIDSIVAIFDAQKEYLNINQLKFSARYYHNSHHLPATKSYVIALLDSEKKLADMEKRTQDYQTDQEFLSFVHGFDNLTEMLKVCVAHYNHHNYIIPIKHMTSKDNVHMRNENMRAYDTMLALLQERTHNNECIKRLKELVNTSKCIDEKCALVTVLFVAYRNSAIYGLTSQNNEILSNESSEIYYKKFENSKFYPFLLRNISYYIESSKEGMDNFDSLLKHFQGKDVVNYIRSLSNYLCYLMKIHNQQTKDEVILSKLSELALKAKEELDFYDEKYSRLNINYGLYLMMTDNGSPSEYFNRIQYKYATTETPYIYTQINHAMYFSKVGNVQKSILMLDDIYDKFISKTSVNNTIGFYFVNRMLVEFLSGGDYMSLVAKLDTNRYGGDYHKKKTLINFYMSANKGRKRAKYSPELWYKLFKPGYIFYRDIDPFMIFNYLF